MKLRYKILNSFLALIGLAVVALMLTVSYTADCGPPPQLAAGTDSMKAVRFRCYGPPDVLEFAEVEKPIAAADELLIKVHAAAVNPYDWHNMRGSPYLMRLGAGVGAPEDTALGVDFAGTVEAVGKDVEGFAPGDEVFGGVSGSFGEYVAWPVSRSIVHIPEGVSFEQAAAAPIAALTALQALRDQAELTSGQKVLINGASGGVGTFAVQIAKSMGLEVAGVCSTRNVAMVRSLGADRVFDYTKENYTESNEQFDAIIDMVGNHSISDNRKVLKETGSLVMVGGPKGNWIAPMINPLKALIVSPFVDQRIGMFIAQFDADDLQEIGRLMASGEVKAVIDRRFTLDEVADAIRHSEKGRARGKIVIDLQ